ncbi:MAG: hypothetical protein ACYC1I_11695 [Acidimicrobiales bacterium]
MAGPTTEVLNDDIRELKSELRDIRGDIDVMKSDLHKTGLDLARLSAEFGVFKWLIGLCLVATLSSVGVSIWWAATIISEVRHLSGQVAEIRAAIVPTIKTNGK